METGYEKQNKTSVFLRHPWLRRTLAGVLAVATVISAVAVGGRVQRDARVNDATDTVRSDTAQTEPSPSATPSGSYDELEPIRVTAPWDSEALKARMEANAAATPALSEFAQRVADINAAIEGGEYEQALALLDGAETLAESPDEQAVCLALRGNCEFYLENYTSALACYDSVAALEQQTFTAPALCGMIARCRMLLEEYDAVVSACTDGLAAIDDDTSAADLYVLRGTAHLQLGDYAAARDDFQASIDAGYSDPDTLRTQIDLCAQMLEAEASGGVVMDEASYAALTAYAAGQYEQAAALYAALYESGSASYTPAQVCSCVAKCDLLLGRYEDALTWSQRGLDANDASERATLLSLRGTAYMALGRNTDAAADYDAAVAAGYPDAVTLNAQSSACYYFAAQFDDAIRTSQAAVDGGDESAALWLALSRYMTGDYAAAADDLARALTVEQSYCDRSELHRLRSRAQLLSGDFSGAAESATLGLTALTEEGAATSDILAELYALRGAAWQSGGEYQSALDDFAVALELGYTGAYELCKQSALCAFLLGDNDAAAEFAHSALDLGEMYWPGDERDPEREYASPDGELYGWLGLAWFSAEEYALAEQAFALSAESDSPQENLYFYMGVCRFSQDDYAGAAEYFTQSIDLGQTAERCVYNRGLCYLQLRRYADARTDIEAAAEQQTDPDVASEAAELLKSLKTVLY